MLTELRDQGRRMLDEVPEEYLPMAVKWLELLASTRYDPQVEPEELWLLASGRLKTLVDAIEEAPEPMDNWRSYLDEL